MEISSIISDEDKENKDVTIKEEGEKVVEKKKFPLIKVIFSLLLILIIFIGIISAYVFSFYNSQINKPLNEIAISKGIETNKLNLTIQKGMSTDQIANMLSEMGLITDPRILKAYMFLNKDKTIQAGYYRLNNLNELNLQSLVDLFQKGSFETKLTFLEGWRVEQYVDYLDENMGPDFANEFAKSEYIKEGYLFPDTYIIEADYLPSNLASWMRNTFDKRFSQELKNQAELRGLTPEQVIIFASILEREMNIKKDMPIVAGILVKRWQNDWPLQADATVQYVKGNSKDWWPKITGEDTRTTDSPYNTYQNKDLPPAPISNPGLDSLKAVAEYQETPYWFYITGKDGVTYYAETLDQHNQNIAKYLR